MRSAFSRDLSRVSEFVHNVRKAGAFNGQAPCACAICSGAEVVDVAAKLDGPQFGLNAADRGEAGPNGKASYTIDEAGAQITRTNSTWNGTGVLGQAASITYAFRASAPATMPNGTSGFSVFNAQQILQAELALQSWSDVANISFTRAGSGTSGGAAYSDNAQLLFGNYSSGASGAAAFAYFPGNGVGGDAWFNSSLSYNASPSYLNYGRLTITHEIGHSIGLSHPGTYNAGTGSPTYANSAVYYEDTRQYSIMSYWSETNSGASFGGSYVAAPMLDDIAAAQRLYGANMATRTGDTVYGFNSNTGRDFLSATSSSSPLIFAAWDAGGTDTFDFSGYAHAQVIDLNAGNFSEVGGLRGNVAIAQGATIENAIGGSGADRITGNAAANRLEGRSGDDTIAGGAGDDVLAGGAGRDLLTGGAGRDTFLLQAAADSAAGTSRDVIADFAQGEDRIALTQAGGSRFVGAAAFSGAAGEVRYTAADGVTVVELDANGDRTADAQVELTGLIQLTVSDFAGLTAVTPPLPPPTPTGRTLTGTSRADALTGGDGDDTLYGLGGSDQLDGGAGNDVLVGGARADTLTGGAGADRFVWTAANESTPSARDRIQDFQTGVDKLDLSGIDANANTAGDDAFRFISGAFTRSAGELRGFYSSGRLYLEGDVNGDGAADFSITLMNSPSLAAADLIL